MWRKTFFCWPLLSGVKTVAFFDIAMIVISSLFLLLVLIFNDDGAAIFLIALFEFLLVTVPRGIFGIMITKKKYPQNLAKYYSFVRLGTLLPLVIMNILEMVEEANINEDKRNRGDTRRGSRGGIIFFGIVFTIGNIILDLFFAHILFSYFKNGNEFDPRRNAFGANANHNVPNGLRQMPNTGLPATGGQNLNNREIVQHPNGLRVGGEIDENALESKDPKVVQKQLADVELSLNGGIDKNNDDDLEEFDNQPVGNMSNDDTPPDPDGFYNQPETRVVDPANGIGTTPQDVDKPFPKGSFN